MYGIVERWFAAACVIRRDEPCESASVIGLVGIGHGSQHNYAAPQSVRACKTTVGFGALTLLQILGLTAVLF